MLWFSLPLPQEVDNWGVLETLFQPSAIVVQWRSLVGIATVDGYSYKFQESLTEGGSRTKGEEGGHLGAKKGGTL